MSKQRGDAYVRNVRSATRLHASRLSRLIKERYRPEDQNTGRMPKLIVDRVTYHDIRVQQPAVYV